MFYFFWTCVLKKSQMRLPLRMCIARLTHPTSLSIYCLVNVQSYRKHKCFGCHVILGSIGSSRFHSSGCDTYLRSIIESLCSDKCEIKKKNCKKFKITQDSILCNFNVVGGEGSFGHTPCPKRLPSFCGVSRRGPFQNKTSQFKKINKHALQVFFFG